MYSMKVDEIRKYCPELVLSVIGACCIKFVMQLL